MAQKILRRKFEWRLQDSIWVAGIVLLLLGAWGMFQRLALGLAPTALGSYVPWGLWVAVYDYLVWIEVGSLLVFNVLVYVAGQKQLAPMKPIVLFTGLIVLVMALLIVLIDLGHFDRFWHVLVYPDFRSMITWMVWLHIAYSLLLAAKLFLVLRSGESREKLLKSLSLLSLPLGLALIIVSGSIFGVVAARPLWNTASMPLRFLLSAVAAGSSLLLLLTILFWPNKKSPLYRATVALLANLTRWLILVGVFTAGIVAFTMLYGGSGNPAQVEALQLILAGPYWWSFWIIHILLGVLVPLIILFTVKPENRLVTGIAAALNVITFVVVTLNIVIPVLVTPELEGLATAFSDLRLYLNYLPNLSEWLVIIFVFGLGGLLYGLGLRWLPVWPKATEAGND